MKINITHSSPQPSLLEVALPCLIQDIQEETIILANKREHDGTLSGPVLDPGEGSWILGAYITGWSNNPDHTRIFEGQITLENAS